MSSASDAVFEVVDRDVFIQEALARDIVNFYALATWLKKNHGLDGTQDAIAKVLRRYADETTRGHQDAAWKALSVTTIHPAGRRCGIVLRRGATLEGRLEQLLSVVGAESEGPLRLVTTKDTVLVIVDEEVRDKAIEALGATHVVGTPKTLFEIAMVAAGEAAPRSGLLALAVSALNARAIKVAYAMNGSTQQLLFVAPEEQGRAFEALLHLVHASRDQDSEN